MKVGIVVFPGSNCDHDTYHAVHHVLKHPAAFLWHKERDLKGSEVVIIPGGFAYGDYLRCGAIARFSPVMDEILRFSNQGGKVIGICNGFQILTEAHLLPGALIQNASCKFVCRSVPLRIERTDTSYTRRYHPKQEIRLPIAHGGGNYFIDDEGLRRLEGEGRVVIRYLENPNGSRNDIAGIINDKGNVFGLMPHPERASEDILGCSDGLGVFRSILES